MSHSNAEALSEDRDEQLDRAIEELRGVLQQEEKRPQDAAPETASSGSSVIMDIPVDVQIVLGTTEMAVSELMTLQKGSTVALDRRIGEPIDVMVNGRRIARGELTVLENDSSRFAVRLTEIITAKNV